MRDLTNTGTMQLEPDLFNRITAAPHVTRNVRVGEHLVSAEVKVAAEEADEYITFATVTGTDGATCFIGRMAWGWMVSAGDGWLETHVPPTVTFPEVVEVLANPTMRKALTQRDTLTREIAALNAKLAKVDKVLGLGGGN